MCECSCTYKIVEASTWGEWSYERSMWIQWLFLQQIRHTTSPTNPHIELFDYLFLCNTTSNSTIYTWSSSRIPSMDPSFRTHKQSKDGAWKTQPPSHVFAYIRNNKIEADIRTQVHGYRLDMDPSSNNLWRLHDSGHTGHFWEHCIYYHNQGSLPTYTPWEG